MTTAQKIPVHTIPEHRRTLYFRVIDGSGQIETIGERLGFLDVHFPKELLDVALKWLIDHKFTGDNFMYFWRGTCGGSDLELHRRLLQVITKERNKALPLFAAKNFRL